MNLCMEKSSRALFAGSESWAIFWETLHLSLVAGVPRKRFGLWIYTLIMIPFVFLMGYWDSRAVSRCDESMIGLFSAFPFMFATFPLIAFHYLATRPMGFPRSREATEKAGYLFVAWALIVILALSFLILGVLHFLGSVMPEFETARMTWSFVPPSRPHIPFLPLLVMPVVLVLYLLWPRSSAMTVLTVTGNLFFILLHGLIDMGGYGWPSWIALGISVAAWVSLPFLWRRRVKQGIWIGTATRSRLRR